MTNCITILAAGEVLWDLFPDGPRFGGAPANFACHAAAFGAQVSIASRVGDDELGRQAEEFLENHDVNTQALQVDSDHSTGSVAIRLDAEGKPTFTIHEDVAWDYLEPTSLWESLVQDLDAICFGTLAQRGPRSRQALRQLVQSVRGDRLRLLDLNLRAPFYDADVIESSLQIANALKLNEEELEIVGQLLDLGNTEDDRLARLQNHYALRLIAPRVARRGRA